MEGREADPSSNPGGEVGTARPLRSDAERNRLRMLQGARQAIMELGLNATVEQIAERAGIGIGTIYRRFPTKDALVEAIVLELNERWQQLAADALERPDPWEALAWFLHQGAALQAANRGLREIILAHPTAGTMAGQVKDLIAPAIQQLMALAKQTGQLREDLTFEDVFAGLCAVGAASDLGHTAEVWHRLLDTILNGMRSPAFPRSAE